MTSQSILLRVRRMDLRNKFDEMNHLPASLHRAIVAEVGAEKILWSGAPDPAGYARRSWKSCLIGVPFTAFAIFWLFAASGGLSDKPKPAPPLFMLFGSMFVGFGLWTMLAPARARWKSRRMAYVVTTSRAIIFEDFWDLRIRSFNAAAVAGYERESHGDSSGDIIFHRTTERRGRGTVTIETGFLGLRDFQPAETALRTVTQRDNSAATTR